MIDEKECGQEKGDQNEVQTVKKCRSRAISTKKEEV